MASGRVSNQAGYAGVARSLALQALAIAVDTAPHRAREGERRWPMAMALPAARVLIGQGDEADRASLSAAAHDLGQTLADPGGKVTDGFGHTRPVYGWLALHLMGTAAKLADDALAMQHIKRAAVRLRDRPVEADDDDERLQFWADLIAWQHGLSSESSPESPPPASNAIEEEPKPLVKLGPEDLIDSWTYRELIGLHGLYLTALLAGGLAAAARVRSAAHYHLGHTQPDYTTYQPWGLSAFASDPQTTIFAEQQLHDVATHLSIEGPGGAVLPALLLAEAWATMSGRVSDAWKTL